MRYELFSQVALAEDFPIQGLCAGDLATVVDYHQQDNREDGYSLEVFNALGTTIAVITVAESQIVPLHAGEILTVRSLMPGD